MHSVLDNKRRRDEYACMEHETTTQEGTTMANETTGEIARKVLAADGRIKVECLECGKKFQTRSVIPECPRCHGVDVDVR